MEPVRSPAKTYDADGATPAMAQWFAIKADHPDALLFFRMGDFYEMFFDDAIAAAAALDYVRATQVGKMPRLSPPTPLGETGLLAMDAATRASLEIARARDGGTTHTLLASVQRTMTAAGARLLGEYLAAPLTDAAAIAARQDGWGWMAANGEATAALRAALRGAPDMARALGRLSLGRGSPRDLGAIRDGLAAAQQIAGMIAGAAPLAELAAACQVPPALPAQLAAALTDPAPARLEDGAIASGFDGELDGERALRDDSRRVIAGMQLDFAQRFGVASLKIRHHAQLGYIVEVPAVAVEKLRGFPELTLRQGMANGARFTHADLSDLDRRINEAAERASAVDFRPARRADAGTGRGARRLRDRIGAAGCAARMRQTGPIQHGRRRLVPAGADRDGGLSG